MKWSDHTRRARAYLAVAMLLFIGLIPILTIVDGLTFRSNVPVVSDGIRQNNFDLEATGAGASSKVFVAYEHEFTNNAPSIMFKKSSNGGETFGTPLDFADAAPAFPLNNKQRDPAIAVSGNNIAVVYTDNSQRDIDGLTAQSLIMCSVSSDGGDLFTAYPVTPKTMSDYPDTSLQFPQVSYDSSGNIFVVWKEIKASDAGGRLYISYSTNSGVSWSTPQKVYEQPDPSGAMSQRWPSVAADGENVYIVWNADPEWRQLCWFSKASTASLGIGSLTFDTPVRISESGSTDSYYPEIVADDDGVHIIWWDFSTDPNENNNQNAEDPDDLPSNRGDLSDRASAMYMGSVNHGVSFGDRIKVNSTVNAWHSPPTIALGEDGTIAVSWVDLSILQPRRHANVWVSTSTDGESWIGPYKVTDYEPDINKWSQEVAVDSGGDVHSAWFYIDPSGTDRDIMHSRSILNQYPDPVEFQGNPSVGDFWARLSWVINKEPDFQEYKIYISDVNSTFSPSEDPWPTGNLYNTSTAQGMNQELFNKNMMPDTTYWVKVAVMDRGGLVSFTDESKQFHTEPINLPPRFERDMGDIYIEEDGSLLNAINLTDLKSDGSIWDDIFKGNDDLTFDYEFQNEDPIITARVREWTANNDTYQALDIFSRSDLPNVYGVEPMRLKVIDSGTDGGLGTPDDLFGYSNIFTIHINATNDAPYWKSFQDIKSGHTQTMTQNQKEVIVKQENSGCVEDLEYEFSFYCEDFDDDDFVTYECSDPRVVVIKDSVDLQKKSIFKFTPTNDDVPMVNMTITATDKAGGSRNLTLSVAVEGTNDRPIFTMIDSVPIEDDYDELEFDIMEEDPITFRVAGVDIDLNDRLSIRTDPSGIVSIEKADFVADTWDITYQSTNDDSGKTISFDLMLEDKIHEFDRIKVIINVANAQDRPLFFNKAKFEWFFDDDLKDVNEWPDNTITAEWGEGVRFKPYASDPDNDALNYTWRFSDVGGMSSRTVYEEEPLFKFYPPDGIFVQRLKFEVNLSVSDGHFDDPLSAQFELWVYMDADNDNDGLPDIREVAFFGNLDHGPEEDYDNDTFSNMAEIGFNVDQTEIELKQNKVDKTQLPDPTEEKSFPGHTQYETDDNGDKNEDDEVLEPWKIAVIAIVIALLLVVIIGVLIVFRISKNKEREDDEAAEKFIKEQDRRQKEISGMYGDKMRAGEIIGPDQSTLNDLKIDLGGQVYHDEGSGGLAKGEKKDEGGPAWQSSGGQGPLFDSSAKGMEFGESLDLEAVPEGDEMDHTDLDEDELNASMDALMDSAEEFEEDAMGQGGAVLIGAVPMEEQIAQMKGGNKVSGPRRPPPGQENADDEIMI